MREPGGKPDNPFAAAAGQTLLLCTAPSEEVASALAARLVEGGLAACVNILPALRSVYRWQGKVESASEHLLLIKTISPLAPEVAALVRREHPYECPELIQIGIEAGLALYLGWITGAVRPGS